MKKLAEIELWAWVGEDEFRPTEIGLKQGSVPAGLVPMVSVDREKMEKYWPNAERQAATYGKKIYFCRFALVEVVKETAKGEPPCPST